MQSIWRFLILNGFLSYIKFDFVDYVKYYKILLFSFLPHTTHFLQPLDVVCFQPLKYYHAEAVDNAARAGDITFSKTEFLAVFQDFRSKAFKHNTILSAFRKTGIVPYDPSKVLDLLREKIDAQTRALGIKGYNAMIEEIEPSDLDKDSLTPTEVKKLHQFGQEVIEDLSIDCGLSPQLRTRILKYIKGASSRIDFSAQIEEDLHYTQAAEAARASKKKTTQRRVTGGGIISVTEARMRIKDRANEEAATEGRRAEKRQKRSKQDTNDSAAVASERSKQNLRQHEQIIEF
jgi:hypothetical protein